MPECAYFETKSSLWNIEKARPVLSDKERWSSSSRNHMQHFAAHLYQLVSPARVCTYTAYIDVNISVNH